MTTTVFQLMPSMLDLTVRILMLRKLRVAFRLCRFCYRAVQWPSVVQGLKNNFISICIQHDPNTTPTRHQHDPNTPPQTSQHYPKTKTTYSTNGPTRTQTRPTPMLRPQQGPNNIRSLNCLPSRDRIILGQEMWLFIDMLRKIVGTE